MKGSYIAIVLALIILSGTALAGNYTITKIKPNSVAPSQNAFVLVTIQNTGDTATQVRAYLISNAERITVTDSWDYVGTLDWMETRTAVFAVHAASMPEGNYSMTLEIKDSTEPANFFNFSLPISNYPLPTEIGVGNATGNGGTTGTGAEEGTGDFNVELITLLDESDNRIDPTDKATIGIALHNRNTDGVSNVQARILEDFGNIKVPLEQRDYGNFGGKQTKTGYFDIETIDVSPGIYQMNLSLTYDKGGKEHMANIPFNITVSGGYSVTADLLPDSMEANPMQQIKMKLHIRNTGTVDDTYKIYFRGVSEWVQQADRQVSVAKGTDKDVEVTLLTPDATGAYTLTAEAISNTLSAASSKDTSVITIGQEIKAMHQIELTLDKHSTDVPQGKGGTFDVMVTNLGTIKDAVTIKVKGSDWAYLSPSTIELEPMQAKSLTLYVAPPIDARIGTYALNLTATTFGGEASAKEQVAVYVAQATEQKGEISEPVKGAAGAGNRTGAPAAGFASLAKDIKGFGNPILTLLVVALLAAILISMVSGKEEPEKMVALGRRQ